MTVLADLRLAGSAQGPCGRAFRVPHDLGQLALPAQLAGEIRKVGHVVGILGIQAPSLDGRGPGIFDPPQPVERDGQALPGRAASGIRFLGPLEGHQRLVPAPLGGGKFTALQMRKFRQRL